MQNKHGVVQAYNQVVASFVRNSLFYGLSLDKRHSVLDHAKFMNDPWLGDSSKGKNLLSGILSFNLNEFEIDVLDVIEQKVKVPNSILLYINSFSWIRDVQAVGGVGARRYVRNIVSRFIEHYKQTKKFWMGFEWDADVTSERIINWMNSYSFFAIGSDDAFQKEVLSSITEQYSHISKIYKAETDPMVSIMSMKAMLFYLVAMKNNQKRQARHFLSKISEIVVENIDQYGMYKTRNPTSLFNIFRSLIEVRFIARNMDINISDNVFKEILCKIASVIRFFRMGDGTLSQHPGDSLSNTDFLFRETRHIIDTALSLVDTNYKFEENKRSICGFDRISTKKSTVILNKLVSNIRSPFSASSEPGINIFDFEASFQSYCLVRRSDIAILWNNHMIKANRRVEPNISISKDAQNITYTCEAVNFDRTFQFAVRREIAVGIFAASLSVRDFIYTSADTDVFLRLAIDNKATIEKINLYSFLIRYGKYSYIFSLNASNGVENHLSIQSVDKTSCSTIIISLKNKSNTENQIVYSIVQQ